MVQFANSWEACRAAFIIRSKADRSLLFALPGPEKAAA